jgi:creatinine amidohydrolase
MPHIPHLLAKATYKAVKDSSYEVAVLPWGATEAHNLHLPYCTDNFECDHIGAESARIAAERGARVIVLPTIPFGVNTGQMDIAFTINMNPSTQAAIIGDVATSLERQGIPKLAILNGHGGNDFKGIIRELKVHHSLFICAVNWYTSVNPSGYFEEPGDHAGEMETSLMLHLEPGLVLPLSEAGSGKQRRLQMKAFREGWAWTPREWTKATDDTGVGNPRAATAEKGRQYFEAVTHAIADFLVELSAADLNRLYQ